VDHNGCGPVHFELKLSEYKVEVCSVHDREFKVNVKNLPHLKKCWFGKPCINLPTTSLEESKKVAQAWCYGVARKVVTGRPFESITSVLIEWAQGKIFFDMDIKE